MNAPGLLRLAALRVTCPGGREVVRGADLALAPGETAAVVGASGAGKSSLVGVLLGWHRLAAGSLHVDGRPAGAAEVEALRPQVA